MHIAVARTHSDLGGRAKCECDRFVRRQRTDKRHDRRRARARHRLVNADDALWHASGAPDRVTEATRVVLGCVLLAVVEVHVCGDVCGRDAPTDRGDQLPLERGLDVVNGRDIARAEEAEVRQSDRDFAQGERFRRIAAYLLEERVQRHGTLGEQHDHEAQVRRGRYGA